MKNVLKNVVNSKTVRYLGDLLSPVVAIVMILTFPNDTDIDVFQNIFWLGIIIIMVTLSYWQKTVVRQAKERTEMDDIISFFIVYIKRIHTQSVFVVGGKHDQTVRKRRSMDGTNAKPENYQKTR